VAAHDDMWADLRKLIRLHRALPAFLATPTSAADARAILDHSLRQRDQHFIAILRDAVYGNARSPYLPLLRRAGATLGDLDLAVRTHGVDATLRRLAAEGVFVSLDEFKGRTPVRRHGLEYAVRAHEFDNPLLAGDFDVMTGGATGLRQRLTIDLDLLVFESAARQLFLTAHGLLNRPMGIWRAVPPGSAAIKHVLRGARAGQPTVRWFTPKRVAWDRLQWKSSVLLHLTLWHGRRAGGLIPAPEFVALDDPGPVAQWLAAMKCRGTPAVLSCPVSAAVRIADYCGQHGVDIAGTVMWVGGEPVSRRRHEIIRASGATTTNGWSLSEAGTLAVGCAAPSERDEVHLLHSKAAVVYQPGTRRLLLTSLLPSSPKLLLNVDSGDHGELSGRACGCTIEAAGFTQHLHSIRNVDKLTAAGMHFTANDALRLVEEILPIRFGGSAADYQLVEEEHRGLGRVALVISPAVGPVDDARVIATALEFLGSLSPGHRMMSENWNSGSVLTVRRERPHVSPVGKVQPIRTGVRP